MGNFKIYTTLKIQNNKIHKNHNRFTSSQNN